MVDHVMLTADTESVVSPGRMLTSGLHELGGQASSFDWLHNPPGELAQRTALGVQLHGQLRLLLPWAGGGCGAVDLAVNVTEGNGYLLTVNGAILRATVHCCLCVCVCENLV